MKIAFIVNDIQTQITDSTTTQLALQAVHRGHEVWYISLSDFSYHPDEHIAARMHAAPKSGYHLARTFLQTLRSDKVVVEHLVVDEFDIVMLRYDPALEVIERPWARLAGINFCRLASRRRVIVLNDPTGLTLAINKIYMQLFPKSVRPRTLITRDKQEIKDFAKEQGGTIVLKPLYGSRGQNVFLIRPEDGPNINQMIEAVLRDGYVIAQEYLPAAINGDTRLFLMNGEILKMRGKVAAIQRLRLEGDMRSNMSAGGKAEHAQITDDMLRIVDMVRPRLTQDGMFLVGLDIVGDKLVEINVFSPGGMVSAGRVNGVNFTERVVDALEHKVDYMRASHRHFTNVEWATL